MTCNRIESDLDAFLDAELDAEQNRAFERHVSECRSCAQLLEEARVVQHALKDHPIPGPSEGFFERALVRAAQTRADPRLGRPPRLVAAGFLGAFATSILTVVLAGLWVRAPDSRRDSAVPAVSIALAETRTLNLVFASGDALDNVALTVELPDGVEIVGHEGRRQVDWNTRLSAGNNVLPLELVAVEGRGGRLVARLQHGDKEKVFVVNVTVG